MEPPELEVTMTVDEDVQTTRVCPAVRASARPLRKTAEQAHPLTSPKPRTRVFQKKCSGMFTASLFIMAAKWNNPDFHPQKNDAGMCTFTGGTTLGGDADQHSP